MWVLFILLFLQNLQIRYLYFISDLSCTDQGDPDNAKISIVALLANATSQIARHRCGGWATGGPPVAATGAGGPPTQGVLSGIVILFSAPVVTDI